MSELAEANATIERLEARIKRLDIDERDKLSEFYGNWCRLHRAKNIQARIMKAEEALPESHRTKLDLSELSYLAQKLIEGHHAIEERRAVIGAEQHSILPPEA
jgi:hypothetical protein